MSQAEKNQTGGEANEGAGSELSHELTLYAEPIFTLGNFTITNSIIMGWVAVLVILILSLILKFKISRIPRGIQNIFEVLIEELLNMSDLITGSRKKTLKFFPIAFSLFLFILVSNWLGLLPGIGSIGFVEVHEGYKTFVPFFRGSTADLNGTLSLAIFSVIVANIIGIVTVGPWNYLNKFINIRALIQIPGKIKEDWTVILINPIKAFVGLIEMVGEAAKVVSLSFRLFGNIFAGEVLLTSMASIFAFILPIPFIFFEILIGVVQAFIFTVLTLVYISMATAEEH